MGLRDVTAQDICYPPAVLLGVDEHIDLVPLIFHIPRIENRVLK